MGILTSEAVVVSVCQLIVDEDGMGAILILEASLHAFDFVLRHLETRPAVPLEAGRFAQAAETGDKATGRHGEAIAAIVGALDGDGQTVRQQEEAARIGLSVGADSSGHCLGLSGVEKAPRLDSSLAARSFGIPRLNQLSKGLEIEDIQLDDSGGA